MGHSKRHYITEAFAEIGKADYAFDLDPEALQTALRRLDAMMAEWNGRGIRIGYSGGNGLGDIDQDTTIPGWADEAIILGLAIRIAPSFGKTVLPDTKASFAQAMNTVTAKTAQPSSRQITGYAGNGLSMPTPEIKIVLGNDDTLEF